MLVTWCIEETERKYGPGAAPLPLPRCARRALPGPGRASTPWEAAEAHLKKLAQLRTREREVLRLLDIPGPPPGGAGEDLYRRLAGYGL